MTLDVTGKILPGDRRTADLQQHGAVLGRIFLAEHRARRELLDATKPAAHSADLHFRGYPREYSPDGRHPNLYDYDNVRPDRGLEAHVRRLHAVRRGRRIAPGAADDCFVIMGHGEELTLRFRPTRSAPFPTG